MASPATKRHTSRVQFPASPEHDECESDVSLEQDAATPEQDTPIPQGPASMAYAELVAKRLTAAHVEEHHILETAHKLAMRARLCSDLQLDCDCWKTPQPRQSVQHHHRKAQQPRPSEPRDWGSTGEEPLWRTLDKMLEQSRQKVMPECKDNGEEDRDLLCEFWELYRRQIGKTTTTRMAKMRAMNAPKDVENSHKSLASTSRRILQEYHCFEELEREVSPPPMCFEPQAVKEGIYLKEVDISEEVHSPPSRCSSVQSFEQASEPGELDGAEDETLLSAVPGSTFVTGLPQITPSSPKSGKPQKAVHRAGTRLNLTRSSATKRLASKFDDSRPRHVPVSSFKGFDDYKQKQQLAESEQLTHRVFSNSARNWLTSSVEKPQYAMSTAAREHKQACHWRLRGNLQQEKPDKKFHRPWSREKHPEQNSAHAQDTVEPMERFAKVCCSSGVHPQPASIRFLAKRPPTLHLRSSGYGDDDLLALTAALPHTSDDRLEHVDLGENRRLSDASVHTLFKALAANHAKTIQVIKLDKCHQLNKGTIELCTQLLEKSLTALQLLDLSGIKIRMKEYMQLSEAIRGHSALRDLRLAETGLGTVCPSPEGVVSHLMSNWKIEALDISWNSLDIAAFEEVGKSLVNHRKLKKLGLSNTGPLADPIVSGSPVLVFLEFLAFDNTLTDLDISNNVLDHNAPLVLESAACRHPNLSHLNLCQNPLGLTGTRSLLRFVASEGCPKLKSIVISECTSATTHLEHNPYDGIPSGYYNLDLEQPGQRAVFRLLYTRLCTGTWAMPPANVMSGTLMLNEKAKPFDFKSLMPNSRGHLEVPTSGKLSLKVETGDMFIVTNNSTAKPYQVVDGMLRRLRLPLICQRAMQAVLGMIKSIRAEDQWEQLLQALGQDFLLTPEQAQSLFFTKSKLISCARDTLGTCMQILPCIVGVEDMLTVAKLVPCFRDLVRIHNDAASQLMLNLENPSGHYNLSLSIPVQRSVVERLLLLNHWENHLRVVADCQDISQHGNSMNFRNEVSDGRSFIWEACSWKVPSKKVLSFDYVSLWRPPPNAAPMLDEIWGRVIERIREALLTNGTQDEEEQEEEDEEEESPVPSRPMSACLDEVTMHEGVAVPRRSSLFQGGLDGLDQVLPSSLKDFALTKGSYVAGRSSKRGGSRMNSHAAAKGKKASNASSLRAKIHSSVIRGRRGTGKVVRGLFGKRSLVSSWKHHVAVVRNPSIFQYFTLRQPQQEDDDSEDEDAPEEIRLSDEDVLWALKCVSSEIFLDCDQLRELLCVLNQPATRANALVYLFNRTIDWPVNGKHCRSRFCMADWEQIQKRIGYINVLPFIQVENTRIFYDLSVHEQRLACHVFLQLNFAESGRVINLRDARIDWSGNHVAPNWSTFPSGVPMSWERWESVPTRGIFASRYVCHFETAKPRVRRKLAATVGGWSCLPERDETMQSMVRKCAVIDDMPEALLVWMEFVMANFSSWREAFMHCDDIVDGSLTMQEFVDGFKTLGFQLTPEVNEANRCEARQYLAAVGASSKESAGPEPWQRGAGVGMMGKGNQAEPEEDDDTGLETFERESSRALTKKSTEKRKAILSAVWKTDPETEARTVDLLKQTYHFLDPDEDMKVTEDEFGAIAGLWSEFKQSTWEFVGHIRDRYGSVENAWRHTTAAAKDGCLSRKEFLDVAREWGFDGPLQQTFTCLDSYRAGLISKKEWMKLEDADPPRRRGARRKVAAARAIMPVMNAPLLRQLTKKFGSLSKEV